MGHRRRRGLTGIFTAVLLLGLTALGRIQHVAILQQCDPAIPIGLTFPGGTQDPAVEVRLTQLLAEDQELRTTASPDLDSLEEQDRGRRHEALAYLTEGKAVSGSALFSAAMLFQHGNCTEHYRLANRLAGLAMEQGEPNAGALYAASLDRYLVSQGKRQKFGTQFRLVGDRMEMFPVDPATTDEERSRYNVPTLDEMRALMVRP